MGRALPRAEALDVEQSRRIVEVAVPKCVGFGQSEPEIDVGDGRGLHVGGLPVHLQRVRLAFNDRLQHQVPVPVRQPGERLLDVRVVDVEQRRHRPVEPAGAVVADSRQVGDRKLGSGRIRFLGRRAAVKAGDGADDEGRDTNEAARDEDRSAHAPSSR